MRRASPACASSTTRSGRPTDARHAAARSFGTRQQRPRWRHRTRRERCRSGWPTGSRCSGAHAALPGTRAVPGVEEVTDGVYRRTLRLPHGQGRRRAQAARWAYRMQAATGRPRDLAAAVGAAGACWTSTRTLPRPRRTWPAIRCSAPLVLARSGGARARHGGRRGARDRGRCSASRSRSRPRARRAGRADARARRAARAPGRWPDPPVSHAAGHRGGRSTAAPWPDAPPPTLQALAEGLATGRPVDPGSDRAQIRSGLLEIPGIGPWTTEYIAMRALGDPDAFCRVTSASGTRSSGSAASAPARGVGSWRAVETVARIRAQHLWAA